MCMDVCMCNYMCAWCLVLREVKREHQTLELDLQTVVSYHVGPGN